MDNDIAIKVDGVYKNFKLPHEKTKSIKSLFTGIHKKQIRSYENQHALKDISFEIKKGEFFGIVGRNGSGKSTLLKILAEIYQPTKGAVQRRGRLVPFIELGVGFNPELTGRENVYLNGSLLGFSKKEINTMYDDIVSFAELERFMDQKLKNYSSGMQVRLAFSVATRSNADILLVDEVLAVGDADFQAKCFGFFKQLKRDKKTVVFVTHDMNAVREYCDRAILIEESQKILEGKADTVATAYGKLFLEAESVKKTKQQRWGNNKMTITDVTVEPGRLAEATKSLHCSVTLQAHEAVERPVAGFMIKNQAGQPILGTNSHIEKKALPPMKAGDTLILHWQVPHIFGHGVYFVDPSVIEYGTTTVYDWWEEAASFKVHNDKVTPYIVNPPIGLNVEPGKQ